MESISRDLVADYFVTWVFLLADIVIKILIVMGIPVLFDSALTVGTIAMRARCNLGYGLNMRDIFAGTTAASGAKGDAKEVKEPVPVKARMDLNV